MAANDTIADMLTRIRNANLARHQTTQIPATKMTPHCESASGRRLYRGNSRSRRR